MADTQLTAYLNWSGNLAGCAGFDAVTGPKSSTESDSASRSLVAGVGAFVVAFENIEKSKGSKADTQLA